MKIVQNNSTQYFFVSAVAVVASVILFGGDASILFPFFALGTGGDCGGGGGGGGEAGGGGGSDCGSCDCESGTCSDCCASGCAGSTPFLCVWDGSKYLFENDVLVAPKTLRPTAAIGRTEYEAGRIGSDRYAIGLPIPVQPDGAIRLALREVEPEETYLDTITLSRVLHPAHTVLVTRPDHDGFHAFDQDDLNDSAGVAEVHASLAREGVVEPVETRPAATASEHMLEPGERIELSGTVAERDAPGAFVLLRSRYRDWTAGVIEELEHERGQGTPSPFSLARSPRMALKAGVFLALSGLLWLTGPTDRRQSDAAHDADILASHFGASVARADACHSLVVEFYDWSARAYREAAVVQPRHKHATLEAVQLPDEAISETGEVRARITATKRHAVSLATLMAPQRTFENEVREEQISLHSAHLSRTGEDFREVLGASRSGEYLHLVPGDTAELAFDAPARPVSEDLTASYVFEAAGFYTPLSQDGRALAGDWVSRLDPEAQAWLREMYALKDYDAPDRRPIFA